jgi:SAM-dependent methyltransferase
VTIVDTGSLPGARGLAWLNGRHPWSHNDHFHEWILCHLPLVRARALDVGCGTGTLVGRLRDHFQEVVGIDADPAMAAAATARFADDPEVTIREQPFVDAAGSFDLVTLVASLHHQPLEAALRHAADLLTPGGRLLVVGLARPKTPSDVAIDLVSAGLNPLVGVVKHPRPVRGGTAYDQAMPMRDPTETFAEISEAAHRVLPGARLRRRLFFRYTLAWERPPGSMRL